MSEGEFKPISDYILKTNNDAYFDLAVLIGDNFENWIDRSFEAFFVIVKERVCAALGEKWKEENWKGGWHKYPKVGKPKSRECWFYEEAWTNNRGIGLSFSISGDELSYYIWT